MWLNVKEVVLVNDPVTRDPEMIVTPPPPVDITVTAPWPLEGINEIPDPAIIWVTPPFPAVAA